LVKHKENGIKKALASFKIDTSSNPDVMPWGSELIYRDGVMVGYATSAGCGYSLNSPIIMGFVDSPQGVKNIEMDYVKAGKYEVEIDGQMYPAELSLGAFYDSKFERVRM